MVVEGVWLVTMCGVLVTVGGGLCAVSDDGAGWFCCGGWAL